MRTDLDRLWTVRPSAPVQPRLLCAINGLDEKLLRLYRQAPARALGCRISPDVATALKSARWQPAIQQMARMAGIALWEREHGQVADSIGV